MHSYIYVIGSNFNKSRCKIGISDNPKERLKQLQTGNAERLQIYYTEKIDSRRKAELIEQKIHKQLSIQKLTGEWFSIDSSTAIAEVQFAFIRFNDDPLLGKLR